MTDVIKPILSQLTSTQLHQVICSPDEWWLLDGKVQDDFGHL